MLTGDTEQILVQPSQENNQVQAINSITEKAKQLIREINDTYMPETKKLERISNFSYSIISTLKEIKQKSSRESVAGLNCVPLFQTLLESILVNIDDYLYSPNLKSAKELCLLIAELSRYLSDYVKTPWTLGHKVTGREASNIASTIRKELHDQGIRGQRVKVILSGSLARGHSDYKYIEDYPKPADYELPKLIRQSIDNEMGVHQKLKHKFSDVDLCIVSEQLFNTITKDIVRGNSRWVLLGEKYPEGMGGSKVLGALHQKLSRTIIAGISARVINFQICKDEAAYQERMRTRNEAIKAVTTRPILIQDTIILDQVIF